MNNRLEYKGYHTDVEIDFEAQAFYGKIEGIKDFVNFQSDISRGVQGIIQEFHCAVDDYLDFCATLSDEPDIPDYTQRIAEYT